MNYRVIFTNCLGLAIFILWIDRVNSQNNEDSCESLATRCLHEILPAAEDILPEICQHLNIQELLKVRSVCLLFQQAADRALQKRGPELKTLQIKLNFPGQPESEHVSRLLKIRPSIALFFTDNKSPTCFYRSTSDEIFTRFAHELPPNIKIVHSEGLLALLDEQPVRITDNRALGFFLPEPIRDLIEVQIFASTNHYVSFGILQVNVNAFVEDIFDVPNTDQEKNNFGVIFLTAQFRPLEISEDASVQKSTLIVVEQMIQRINKIHGTFALWGSNVEWLKVLGFGYPDHGLISMSAMRISGSHVQCWSLVINLKDSIDQISKRLVLFRKNIRTNNKSIGLALVTVQTSNVEDEAIRKVQPVRTAFPGLSIMSYGVGMHMPKYCYNSLEPRQDNIDGPIITYNEDYLCFMVMTYFG